LLFERFESGGGEQVIVFRLRRRINEHAAKTLSSRVEGSGTDIRTNASRMVAPRSKQGDARTAESRRIDFMGGPSWLGRGA
jgi:hypothetical protein